MVINILGTRGEIKIDKPGFQKHSGILIDKKILLDLGEKEFLDHQPRIIFITHLHPDHAFFISGKENINVQPTVYAPEGSPKLKKIKIIATSLSIGSYKIIPIPVIHSLKVKSQGYLIEKRNKRIFYSGDIVDINKKFFHQLSHLDAVLTEASFIRKGGMVRKDTDGHRYGHAGIPDIIRLFKNFTDRIIFTHFGTWFIKDVGGGTKKIKSMQEENLRLEIASDGKKFVV